MQWIVDRPPLAALPWQLLNQQVHIHEIQQEYNATEGNLDVILFNPVTSTIPKWRTLELLRWKQN
jgi:hypothetical protein